MSNWLIACLYGAVVVLPMGIVVALLFRRGGGQ